MGLFDRFRKPEARNLENPTAPVSAEDFLQIMGWGDLTSASGVNVNTDNALGVPAVWSAVNFLSGTLAGLPLHVYTKGASGRKRSNSPLEKIIFGAVNEGMSSFEWRKYMFDQVFTTGRGITYVERSQNGAVKALWPLDTTQVRVERRMIGKVPTRLYHYGSTTYEARDVIDIPFMLKNDGITVRGPISTCRDAIGMAIAASRYGAKAFQSGGIPPVVLQGPFQSGAAAARASDDVAKTTAKLAKEGRPVMALPVGHEMKTIGYNPEQMQLLELQRFSIEQIARVYSLPPVFLQDLTHGTFSNTEQQDLHFVKHTVKRWVEQVEQEMNLKLLPPSSRSYVEFNVDGLLRGDFKTRMDAHATSIQNGIRTPNEVREIENLPSMDNGDDLLIQGATVPIGTQPNVVPNARTE